MLNRPVTQTLMGALLATGTMAIAGQASASAYSDAVLADNPVYYWDMDTFTGGNVSNLGSAGNAVSNQLGNPGGVAFSAGGVAGGGASLGQAADFSSTGDRLSASVLSGGAMTSYIIEFWANVTDDTTAQYIAWHGPNNTPAIILGFNDGVLEAFSGTRTGTDGPSIADGNWRHVVIGIDSAAGHVIYIDGALHSNQTETIAAWNDPIDEAIFIGGSNLGDGFTGQIDEFAVYNATGGDLAALTADVADHFNAVPEPGSLALLAIGGMAMLRRRRG